MTLTLTAALGFAAIARGCDIVARRRALEIANMRLRLAVAARDAALERERDARTAAEHANELQERFLATVSHELRTPLNAIVGWAHVMRVGELSGAQTERAIDGIERNARTQSRLISDLLDVSRLIRGRLTVHLAEIDFRQPVGAAVAQFRPAASAKGLALDYSPGDANVPVMGDAERLQQIAGNLLSNAVKYTPRGGHVAVTITPAGPRAELRVQDSGEGIPAGEFQRLFDPFFQADSKVMRAGLGLGLAIVKELVDLHGGSVDVASEGRGQGATFAVTLPMVSQEHEASRWLTSIEPPPALPQSGSPTVSGPNGKNWPGGGAIV